MRPEGRGKPGATQIAKMQDNGQGTGEKGSQGSPNRAACADPRSEKAPQMFMLHALRVSDGILALSALPGGDGDLAGDLQHVSDWQPSVVLALVTADELAAAGARDFGVFVADHGARWEHLPIRDFGIPDDVFEQRWTGVSRVIHNVLEGGGRVLVQCRGGCGRSGMVVLRLMTEAGEAPGDALARLRSVRPCAVETQEQMTWAMAIPRKNGAVPARPRLSLL
ncbi:protein-tyrosine phosphatase family protein [Salipiger aestuarii]|nr:protein-tyrosine phosphatase family protein [Salipiger aestuarii]